MFLPVAQVIPKKANKNEIKQLNQCLDPFNLRASTPFMVSEASREGRSPFFPRSSYSRFLSRAALT